MVFRKRPITSAVWTSLALAGCAGTGSKDGVLPQDGPSMRAIYESHFEGLAAADPQALRRGVQRPLGDGEADLAGYARSAFDELDVRFRRLPNPTLVMYVFPHLAGAERSPVPGYATAFPMYQRPEYALPGEVPGGVR